VVVRFGGGPLDDTELLENQNVNALVWAGYPGQDGGTALDDILTGKTRLPEDWHSPSTVRIMSTK
jgi:beta-D-xylosidase 4